MMPDTAMVAINVLYSTGARDENPDATGIAHLLEHMMFGGSESAPDFDTMLTAAGGQNNAWTSNDFTSFWDIVPAHNAETLFFLESDRMRAPLFDPEITEIQKSVVTEEFKQQCLNRPYGRVAHHLRRLLYPAAHPYSWPVIGKEPAHIAAATSESLRGLFDRNYSPANAVVAVCGNITLGQTRRWAEKWFGDIKTRPLPRRDFPEIPELPEGLRTETTDRVPATVITLAWLMDGYGSEAYTAADAITDILAAGKASRFYRRLVVDGPGWFTEADASIAGSEHKGFLMLTARLASEDVDLRAAEELMVSEARRLCDAEPPTPREVRRLINRQNSMFTLGNLDCLSMAQTMAMAAAHNEEPDGQLRRYRALTPETISRHAREILSRNYAAVITRPETAKQTSTSTKTQ